MDAWLAIAARSFNRVREALRQHRCSERIVSLGEALSVIESALQLEESLLFFQMMRDILSAGSVNAGLPDIPSMPSKPAIGSCSAAEEYYLEIAHGRVRRGGEANILTSDNGQPVLVEKTGLGESHSAISVCPTVMNGVRLPAGSLFALERTQLEEPTRTPNGNRLPWSVIVQARFLRLTTLAVTPPHRQRAFSRQLEAQVTADMFSPLTSNIEQLRQFAIGELGA